MNSTTDGKLLRIHSYHTSYSDDGVLTVSHPEIVALVLDSHDALPSASKRVLEDLTKIASTYGALVRRDDRSFAAIWQIERGVPAYLYAPHGAGAFEPAMKFKGADEIITLRLEVVDERHGVRTDGKWADSRSPLTVPRRQLALFPSEAAADLAADLQAVLDAGHERGDLKWSYEDAAPQQVRSDVVFEPIPLERNNPALWDRFDPRNFIPGLADALREQRIAAGLDKPYKPYVPGSG